MSLQRFIPASSFIRNACLLIDFLFSHYSRSHSTTPLLLPPTPPSFTLDFAQVLQATAASPARAARIRPGRSAQDAGISRLRSERIVEEEDGWDVVELGGEEGFG